LELDQKSIIYQKAYEQIYSPNISFFPVEIFIDDAASVLCVAAGFVKNASELQFWLENYIGMLARAVTASFLVC